MYTCNKLFKQIIFLCATTLIIILNVWCSIHVFAEDTSSNEFGGFSIEGIPNKNQLDKNASYFYLHEEPKTKDKLTFKLNNSASKEKKLEIKVVDGNTNSNGIVDYTGSLKNNKALKVPLTSIVKPEQKEVIVPKNGSIETNLNVNMPNKKFSGVILGGVIVSEKKADQQLKKGTVGNEYSYTIGIVLTNENKVELFKNVSVELKKVGPVLSAGKKVVQADILNPNPYIFAKAEITGAVYEVNNGKKIKEHSMQNVSIAPYSAFPFQIDWQKNELKTGNYVFKGSVKTAENTWEFEKNFTIKNEEAKQINKESVFSIVLPQWFKYSSMILIGVLTVGTIFVFLKSVNRKNNQKEK
ncbi:DUF916 and DUF3324 domain-containing protein [Enterococcus hirae]|uniref:DUF916 and DUF3324 domain-containing protein n=1 Tax=Enterococcus TaxID=1350 RepID=UPI0015F29C27|nr:DUF916 and DUF3324 domain-containing protein [Enterococcus hirae]EMF0262082.1 DUF916 and DUF3324 domain-containing protein [Enterococcus hirae]MBA5270766.1 DUF916 and DUF3324 domain-containing protein [Enterococcus hirae]MDU1933120.1 DUF916 and DUF3324 domain-containing protein [Enterococcus hirae]